MNGNDNIHPSNTFMTKKNKEKRKGDMKGIRIVSGRYCVYFVTQT